VSKADDILSALDYREFYALELGDLKPVGDDEVLAKCPFHDDQHPSMSVNTATGQYHCHACSASGNAIEYVKRRQGVDSKGALAYLAERAGVEFTVQRAIPDAEVAEHHADLLGRVKVMGWLERERGITSETARQYELGFYRGRVTIPVRDVDGQCVNIRRYDPSATGNDKIISWKKGYGTVRMYPRSAFDKQGPMLITEGEWDTLLAGQHGFNAVTATGGAGTWKVEWTKLFRDRDVVVCYDCDGPGQRGAATVGKNLLRVAASVRVVKLPLTGTGEDITDWFVKYKHTAKELQALIDSTEEFRADHIPSGEREYKPLHLSQASLAQHYFEGVELNCVVAGKDLIPYIVPQTITFQCDVGQGNMCLNCPVGHAGGELTTSFAYDDAELLKMIQVNDMALKGALKQHVGIPRRCAAFEWNVMKAINIEEIRLIPEVDWSAQDTQYVVRHAYYIGHGIETNRSYIMRGITLPDPRNQYATHLIDHAEPSLDTIDTFEITDDVVQQLSQFQAGDGGIQAKLSDIYDDLEANVVMIYQRRDMMTAMDLVWHSILRFDFQRQEVRKGWLEALVVGDTRNGKSQTAQRMIEHYRAGELGTGENTSFAGLIGGLQQINRRWSIQWGKIPLNDRRLFVIDEASSMDLGDIGRMSGVRSSGIAEVIKIQTERTHARTRLLWIANPRSGEELNTYDTGVMAIKELIGNVEDIARFDIILTVANNEVDLAIINAPRRAQVKHTYTSELCHKLVMWAWSRQSDDVVMPTATVEALLDYASDQGRRYHPGIPIVEPAEQRIKLAKLACATAARLFSTEDGHRLMVGAEHAEFAYRFLEACYRRRSLAYDEWSYNQKMRQTLANEGELELVLDPSLARSLLAYDQIKLGDLEDLIGDRTAAKNMRSRLVRLRALRPVGSSFYKKTPAFIDYLRLRFDAVSDSDSAGDGEAPF